MTAQPSLFPDIPSEAVGPETAAVLDLVESDYRRSYDRWLVDEAVRKVAMRDGGTVSTNAVRRELTNGSGRLRVQPQVIGPRLRALTLSGVLRMTDRWEINDDKAGRNAGKVQKIRQWVGK